MGQNNQIKYIIMKVILSVPNVTMYFNILKSIKHILPETYTISICFIHNFKKKSKISNIYLNKLTYYVFSSYIRNVLTIVNRYRALTILNKYYK